MSIGAPVARKGTRIFCPDPLCRVHIATFRYELLSGCPSIGIDLFDFAPGQAREAGDGAICKTCGTPFMRDETRRTRRGLEVHRKLFTDAGWISYPMRTVRAHG